jgi:hypothetical protein
MPLRTENSDVKTPVSVTTSRLAVNIRRRKIVIISTFRGPVPGVFHFSFVGVNSSLSDIGCSRIEGIARHYQSNGRPLPYGGSGMEVCSIRG